MKWPSEYKLVSTFRAQFIWNKYKIADLQNMRFNIVRI